MRTHIQVVSVGSSLACLRHADLPRADLFRADPDSGFDHLGALEVGSVCPADLASSPEEEEEEEDAHRFTVRAVYEAPPGEMPASLGGLQGGSLARFEKKKEEKKCNCAVLSHANHVLRNLFVHFDLLFMFFLKHPVISDLAAATRRDFFHKLTSVANLRSSKV